MKCKKGYKKVGDKCTKTSYSKNGPVNVNNMWIFIIVFGVFIIGGLFLYVGSKGWFTSLSVVNSENIISYLENPNGNIPESCSLSLTPGAISVGESTTGVINDGSNSLCQVFASDGSKWLKVYEGYTDENGMLEDTRTINTFGNYVFRAICDLNNNNRIDTRDCLTNSATLQVFP